MSMLSRITGGLLGGGDRPKAGASYMKASADPFFFNWRPALRDTRHEVAASYVQAVARTVDAVHNSGWLAGCVDQSKAAMIGGQGLRLALKPDQAALADWTEKEVNDWARMVERRFEIWANDKDECDAAGKAKFGQLQEQVVDSYFSHGEVLAIMPRLDRPNAITNLKIKMLPAHKLAQDTNETLGLQQGVTMGDWGYPLKYRIGMNLGTGIEQDVDVHARNAANQQQVLHIFRGSAGQVRGITPFVHVLKTIKQYDQLSDATLTKAMIDAIFAATVESSSPTEDVLRALQDDDEQGISGGSITDYLGATAAWYQNTKIDLGRAGKIAHLFPGEKLSLHGSTNISDNYEAFAKFLLREIARCLGLSFEAISGDYSGATYSSVRMGTSQLWPITLSRRNAIPGAFCQEVFQQWLDEEIASERIAFKGGKFSYLAVRKYVARADWRGPPKPQADDLKNAKAMEVLKRIGIASDEELCAELGTDYEDVYEQRKKEADLRKALDLPDGDTMTPDPVGDGILNREEA